MKHFRYRNLTAAAAVLLTAAAVFMFTACGGGETGGSAAGEGTGGAVQKEEPVSLSIVCVGDIMAHSTNYKAAYDSESGTYDFSENYEYVTQYISSADLALCNVETTFGGGTPRGYPAFCAPDELAEAISGAGFDVAITSNNHMMDSGLDGMRRTLEILRGQGLTTAGSHYDGEESYTMADVNGVKVGIVAYTYETTGTGDARASLNGIPLSDEAQKLVNSFNYNELETTDYDRIQKDIDDARGAGADIVVCYFHWGNEYQRDPDSYQTEMAQKVADMGADIIFASHPHVSQKAEIITSQTGRQVPVFYSLGNFISNQRQETLQSVSNSRYTEQGLIGCADIEYMKSTGEILSETVSVIPVWVDRYKYSGSTEYRIIPLDSSLDSNGTLAQSGHLSRARQALEDVTALVGEEWLSGVTIQQTGDEDDGAA